MVWKLKNVLVAGRRLDGSATGSTEKDAVRRFAAREARRLNAEVALAVLQAWHAGGYTARVLPEVEKTLVQITFDERDYSDWPLMQPRSGRNVG